MDGDDDDDRDHAPGTRTKWWTLALLASVVAWALAIYTIWALLS